MTKRLVYSTLVIMATATAAVPVHGIDAMFPHEWKNLRVYIGAATNRTGKGIYSLDFSATDEQLEPGGLACEAENPFFLAIHPSKPVLYAVNFHSATVAAYQIDRMSGKLTLLDQRPTKGAGPCHISVSRSGTHVAVANSIDSSIAVFPIIEDGRFGELSGFVQLHGSGASIQIQGRLHAHSVTFDGFLVVPLKAGLVFLPPVVFFNTKESGLPNAGHVLHSNNGRQTRLGN